MKQTHLKSHEFSPKSVELSARKIAKKIEQQGDKSYVSVKRQLELLKQLTEFDFGRYLLQNQGINGFWTHYMLTHPWVGRKMGKNNNGDTFTPLEDFMLNRAPTLLATQQRFEIFLKENQTKVKEDAKLACIPSGMMGELLYLDYNQIKKISLYGIDYDPNTLLDASQLAKKQHLEKFISLIECNAWNLDFENKFDLISSNGLNIYEPDDSKVSDLYRQFFKALKPGGKLVTSFLTFPPALSTQSEWDLSQIDSNDALLQKIIFADIIEAKWQCYLTSEQTNEQLKGAGFSDIQFIYDKAKIFPTVVAFKK